MEQTIKNCGLSKNKKTMKEFIQGLFPFIIYIDATGSALSAMNGAGRQRTRCGE